MRDFFKQFRRAQGGSPDNSEHPEEEKKQGVEPGTKSETDRNRPRSTSTPSLSRHAGITSASGQPLNLNANHFQFGQEKDKLQKSELDHDPDFDLVQQFGTHSRISTIGNVHEFMDKQADELILALHSHARAYGKRLAESLPGLQFTLSDVQSVAEPNNWMRHNKPAPRNAAYTRWRADTTDCLLSVRASRGLVEFFIVPEKDVPHISMSEYGSRFRGAFSLVQEGDEAVWKKDKERLSAESAMRFLEVLLDEVAVSRGEIREKSFQPALIQTTERKLEQEKNNLLFKLLNQREELKNQLARDLHDSVIADLMMLKRYLSGDKKLTNEEIIEIVDEVTKQLRDIVNEYSPRQLQEWGLKVGIEDMLDRVEKRTGMAIEFNFQGELPKFPDLVNLHIFRIIQESMNNIEKHASASRVTVTVEANPRSTTLFSITDNGTGFDQTKVRPEADDSHSMGLEGMRERVELIRCFYACELQIESQPTRGTTVTLTVTQEQAARS